MSKEFKRMVFNSEGYTYDEAKDFLINDQGIENPTDDEIYDEISECNAIALKDERFEFACRSKNVEGEIIAIADAGRWNGRKTGIRLLDSLEDILDFMIRYDSFELYIDRYDLKGIGHHHDGTDYLTFREIKPKFDYEYVEEMFFNINGTEDDRIQRYYTRSIRKYFKGYLY